MQGKVASGPVVPVLALALGLPVNTLGEPELSW